MTEITMKPQRPRILFLSGIDFKEKSIQVIRKTPEAYVAAGWDVTYIVSRDCARSGNYFYEKVIDLPGARVIRFEKPLCRLRDRLLLRMLRVLVNKFSEILTARRLAALADREAGDKSFDIIYGYETTGVMALSLLKRGIKFRTCPAVTRFQGTWLADYYLRKRYLKLLANRGAVKAFRLKSDLLIMTDDGTRGDWLIDKFYHGRDSHCRFWTNGVDKAILEKEKLADYREKYKGKKVILSVSRLEGWKRIDRNIAIARELAFTCGLKDFVYLAVGDGSARAGLERLVREAGVEDFVEFTGSVPHSEIPYFYAVSDVFLSMYDLSNVGNPLLEAISLGKLIFTLSNGDTAKWIVHKRSGFIYDPAEDFIPEAAADLAEVLGGGVDIKKITAELAATSGKKIWTWQERLSAEVEAVKALLKTETC